MTGIAGDGHIWQVTTGDVPVALCGYSPPVEDVTDDADPPNVIGQQVVHAAPTGTDCAECRAGGEDE